MAKINISLPDSMLAQIEQRAEEAGTTRSGFVQEAMARYLAQSDHEAERARRAERIERAIQGMRGIGERLPPGPDGVTVIRQMRDAVPPWLPAFERDDG